MKNFLNKAEIAENPIKSRRNNMIMKMNRKQLGAANTSAGVMEQRPFQKRESAKIQKNNGGLLKKTFLFLATATIALPVWSKSIDENAARNVAAQTLSRYSETRGSSADTTLRSAPVQQKTLQLLYKNSSNSENANPALRSSKKEIVYFYVFGAENNEGFVIVSGDDRVTPVLGYSETNGFSAEDMPENLKWWLGEYARQIQFAIENNIEPTQEVKQKWAQFFDNNNGKEE